MPPNVLLICTDQQRFSAMGAYGNDGPSGGTTTATKPRTTLEELPLDILVTTDPRTQPREADW